MECWLPGLLAGLTTIPYDPNILLCRYGLDWLMTLYLALKY